MVILFSERKSRIEKEIIDILTFTGADYISDKTVCSREGIFTIISEYKKTELNVNRGIAVFCDNTDRFKNQTFPKGIIGICEDTNINALELFKQSNTPIISCGLNGKNTVTLSSFIDNTLLVTLQRNITNFYDTEIEPCEFKIKLNKSYSPFSVLTSATILMLKGITPKEF